ncbi:bacteriohemerythrin [Psychromonas ossibalaenae]|uniref:bacteriohemerythrin n=1 Tax=Psychromonas ossibalaenae TaxID=444922 RepID=UPI0003690901|nr:bacteriohemerythrin [Psychromonas ossibalaenae]
MNTLNSATKVDLVPWKDEYNIGIALIDEQHKKLMTVVNELINAVNEDLKSEVILSCFDKLYDYTIFHSQSEEQYFYNLDKAETELHKLQHKHFIEQLDNIKQSLKKDHVSNELLWYLTDWLLIHIQHDDKKFLNKYPESPV